jgi:DNA-binding NtrC family response regulator
MAEKHNKTQSTHIIVADRSKELTHRLRRIFSKNDVQISRARGMEIVLEKFESQQYDVLLVASSCLSDDQDAGIRSLEHIGKNSPMTQILFLAEPSDIHLAMDALKAGIYQYGRLPITDEELRLLINMAVQERPRYGTNLFLESKEQRVKFEKLVGSSLPMQGVYRQIRQAAATDMPILLLGETGTGKDLAAQAIHEQSDRRDAPYVPVNLGALPSELVGSELFGHEKGAFTGAVERREGKFEQAQDGTIFLDEIATIDEKVQVSLLRLIEQKKFHRLGGKEVISTNARLIAASNQDLPDIVERGTFRKDLYYRLDVFRIVMPPLRERRSDIVLLVDEFLQRYNRAFQKHITGIAPECVTLLESYDWPGNVRELKNVIQRGALVCEADVLLPEHLPPRFRPDEPTPSTIGFRVGTPLEQMEREMILRALAETGNNRTEAAKMLGISRRSLYNKLHKHNIQ